MGPILGMVRASRPTSNPVKPPSTPCNGSFCSPFVYLGVGCRLLSSFPITFTAAHSTSDALIFNTQTNDAPPRQESCQEYFQKFHSEILSSTL
ncbi:hypothetical protein [Leptothermofonsia sp. ETS-13]|uniref:hypothetical protein n=1 Tax=Leptothermofonsia sp. ETS-13 TaxID=3035696 RepID=UPI003B9FB129